jgi:hypothetical protein
MSLRKYNKLYVHTDREEGSEKILLGYEDDTKELILQKNVETIFHIPYYTEPVNLATSTLIQDGATPGYFPAASDRIFKNLNNYGKTTANGEPSDIADGVWYCSWLYKTPDGGAQWMDRYYNPGAFVQDVAFSQLTEGLAYKKNDPVYRDVPTTMLLEQGVQYRYFHVGEKYAKVIVESFGGVEGDRLKLNLDNWGSDDIDRSNQSRQVFVKTDGPASQIYSVTTESDRVTANNINFNNKYKTVAYTEYDSSYGLLHEYTLAFWAYSDNWYISQATQLVGNYTNKGGTGVFIDTLSSYPFLVIPETAYGHLLYVNEDFNQFLDKSLHPAVSLTATPSFVAIDTDSNVIIVNGDNTRKIKKIDHTGRLINETNIPNAGETPRQLLCGQYDTVVVITDKNRYTYDTNFNLLNTTRWETLSSAVTTYAYDVEADTAELISVEGVHDCKFIGSDFWCLTASDDPWVNGDVYVRYSGSSELTLFAEFEYGDNATAFAIDPYNRIWVMHANNKISVYDTTYAPESDPLFEFSVGLDQPYAKKNINFVCVYNRETQTREWKCVIYYGDSIKNLENPQLYVIDMKGKLNKVVDILSLFDLRTMEILKQTQENMDFFGTGDFTGYEHRRIFNNLSPFKNNSQLILRTALKDSTKSVLPYTLFKQYYSMGNWNYDSWQHIAVTLKNRMLSLYSNGSLVMELPYSGKYEMSYELQPAFYIGSPVGAQYGFNQEIGKFSAIFNGLIQDVKIYDYAIESTNMEMFQRAAIPGQNIYWTLPTPSIQYIETIERMFKNKIPGAKSSFFNVKICGTQITDLTTRLIIEEEIRTLVEQIKPVYANFLQVNWVD